LKRIRDLFKSTFGKNVIMIAGGTAFAQVLSYMLSPIISRIYTPEDFGVLTVYSAILGMISLLGALSYDSAIPIAENDEEAINVFGLCLLILCISTIGLALVLYLIGKPLLSMLNAEQLLNYRFLLVIGFFLTGLYTIVMSWAFRKRNFKAITKTKFSQSITGNSVKLGLGFLNSGALGLVLGKIFSESAGITTLATPIIKRERHLLQNISKDGIRWVAKRYVKFPLFSAPGLLLVSVSSQLPKIFISSIYGAQIIGLYGFAFTLVYLPMGLIGKAIQDVFYGEAASIGKSDPRRVKELSNKLLKKLIIIGSIPLAAFVLFGPVMFSFVFGSNWFQAGEYARILSIQAFTHLIFHPISTIFGIFERQSTFLVLNVVKLILAFAIFGLTVVLSLNSFMSITLLTVAFSFVELLKFILAQRILDTAIRRN